MDDVLSVSDGKAVEDPNGNLADERELESLKVVPPQQLVQITPTGGQVKDTLTHHINRIPIDKSTEHYSHDQK